MKYFIGFLLAVSISINIAFIASLKRYQIEIREQKRYTDQKISYYEYWSFTFPRQVNVPDTTLSDNLYTRLWLGDFLRDTSLPEHNYYVQFSHN